MSNQFYDLAFERLPDGGIHLEQSAGLQEPSVIHLHPEQNLFIARRLCGMKSDTAEQVRDLERRIAVLTDKLQNIVCNKFIREEIIERIGDGFEILVKLDALLDLALEFDGGRLEPEEHDEPSEPISKAQKTQQSPITAVSDATGKQLGLAV